MLRQRFATNQTRWLVGVLWLVAAAAGLWRLASVEDPLHVLPAVLHAAVHEVGVLPAAMIFLGGALVRPYLLLPPTLLVVGAGLAFGPGLGWVLAVVGVNIGAASAWAFGRWLGAAGAALPARLAALAPKQGGALSGFAMVCMLRLANVPYDLVSYAAGGMGVRYPGFALGTLLGSLPSVSALVLAGGLASSPRPWYWAILAVLLIAVGLLVGWRWRARLVG